MLLILAGKDAMSACQSSQARRRCACSAGVKEEIGLNAVRAHGEICIPEFLFVPHASEQFKDVEEGGAVLGGHQRNECPTWRRFISDFQTFSRAQVLHTLQELILLFARVGQAPER